ncbi:hypothetical protein [Coleofasciculus sp. F4-SAH-05]|uniref:hypothetical protein n=1 Tax=Coleofasciculus sp. F4-SAH-05 TaxID=3069525 RepID=UPI0032F3E20B
MSVTQSSFSPVQNQSGTGSQRILSRRFTDVEHFKEFYGYRQLEITQLTPGFLKSEFLSVKIGNLYFIRNRANHRIQSWGAKQKDYLTFSIVWVAVGDNFYSHKRPISSPTSLFGFDRQRDVDLVTAPGMMTDVLIPVETFQSYANQLQRHDFDDRFLVTNHVILLPHQMR